MNIFKTWKEYLNTQGKTQDKPIIDPLADTSPKPSKAPDKPVSKGKGWDAHAALSEKPKDYAGPGTDKGQQMQPKGEKNGKGLDKEGDSKLIYEPKTTGSSKEVSSWPKSKTENFLQQTRGMTLAEFASYITSQNKVDGTDPVQAVRAAVSLANANDNVLAALVREFKRSGGMNRLVAEMFQHQETFAELASLMVNEGQIGTTYRRLSRAVSEITAPPATGDEVDTGASTPPMTPPSAGNTPPPQNGQNGRKPVRSIGGSNNQMDLTGGGANIVATQGNPGQAPPPGSSTPARSISGFAAKMTRL